ncbi:DUF3014 domain-containing protein [Hydrogenophaga sp.]|uniref:DUF3014 domain-containing protein n=1 Tax=Hydrogenophaga sp. TaxID=1904254 RepID=UPI0025B7D8AF|nr:DUF3014 domain-containing protein [Hydrogenophaga sp.]
MKSETSRLPAVLAALAVLAAIAYFGWPYLQRSLAPAPVTPTVAVAPAPLDVPPTAPLAPVVPEPPAIEHPIEPAAAEPAPEAPPLPALADADPLVREKLSGLLSRKDMLTFLQLDGFVRRVVATVDNLERSHAPAIVWPVNPTPERFTTLRRADGVETIHPDNSRRYRPLVQMIESVDTARAVAVYRTLYPLFQQAYEGLGFPGSYFNDRLVKVLDHLISTPVPAGPLAVTLVEVKGTVPSLRPWVRYEYADPAYESMSAGRKMLLRVGADNQRRLQAKLKDIRQRVARR